MPPVTMTRKKRGSKTQASETEDTQEGGVEQTDGEQGDDEGEEEEEEEQEAGTEAGTGGGTAEETAGETDSAAAQQTVRRSSRIASPYWSLGTGTFYLYIVPHLAVITPSHLIPIH